MAKNGDRAATSAARDLCPVDSLPRPSRARNLYDSIGGGRTQSAGRIARVRLIHQLARQFHSLLADLASKRLGEKSHAVMFVNRMRRRDSHCVAPFGGDARNRIGRAFVA